MKIKPMLTRLQNTIGRDDLIEQMVLVPTIPVGAQSSWDTHPTNDKTDKLMHSAKFIVGYNSSCNSHTALDIALCMAHQARLASNMQITVEAVFVVEDNQNWYLQDTDSPTLNQSSHDYLVCDLPNTSKSLTPVLTEARFERNLTRLEQADIILCQARSLAEEWQSHFQASLRFGSVAGELKQVIKSAGADVLFLGCNSPHHPIIESLGSDLRCAILGIPTLF